MAEEKRYLDYDGLAYLVEKLTNKIQAVAGGTDSHAVEVLKSVVTFPSDPDYGTTGSKGAAGAAGADDIPITDVIAVTDDMTSLTLESDGGSFALINPGRAIIRNISAYYISCTAKNETGSDIHANLRLTIGFSDWEERTVNVIAVQRAAVAEDGVYAAYTDADGVNRIAAPDKWDESLGTLCGVAVVEGGRGLLVAPNNMPSSSTLGFFGADVGDWGGAMTEDEAEALCDMDGKTNTLLACLKGAAEEESAVSQCRDYSYGTVCARRWFIGSLGQWKMVGRHYDAVNSALSVIGGGSLYSSAPGYISSTMYDSTHIWTFYPKSGETGKLISSYNATEAFGFSRAFAEWDFVL